MNGEEEEEEEEEGEEAGEADEEDEEGGRVRESRPGAVRWVVSTVVSDELGGEEEGTLLPSAAAATGVVPSAARASAPLLAVLAVCVCWQCRGMECSSSMSALKCVASTTPRWICSHTGGSSPTLLTATYSESKWDISALLATPPHRSLNSPLAAVSGAAEDRRRDGGGKDGDGIVMDESMVDGDGCICTAAVAM